MSSFASAKGPSITVRFAPEYLTRQPFELGFKPEASSSTPAFCSSSWYFCISIMSFSEGIAPASESFVALTIIMNLMLFSNASGPAPPLPFLLCSDLRAQALLLLPQLGRELGAEVLRLEHLADLDLGILPHRIGAALDPFDRLFLGLHLPDPETRDQLLRLGEGPVDHGALRSREPDACALRARVEPLAREHHAGFHQVFVELPHRGEEFFVRITPASESLLALTMIMNRIVFSVGLGAG